MGIYFIEQRAGKKRGSRRIRTHWGVCSKEKGLINFKIKLKSFTSCPSSDRLVANNGQIE